MVETERTRNAWMDGHNSTAAESTVESREEAGVGAAERSNSDETLGFGERAVSAAGAAFLSAIIVNPLDVAKVLLYNQNSYMNFC
jgi:solute carrier family 25 protein 39/40